MLYSLSLAKEHILISLFELRLLFRDSFPFLPMYSAGVPDSRERSSKICLLIVELALPLVWHILGCEFVRIRRKKKGKSM